MKTKTCLTIANGQSIIDRMGRLQEITLEAIRNSPVSCYRISKDTGISQATLSLIIHRKRNLGLDMAERILDYLGYTVEVTQPESEVE